MISVLHKIDLIMLVKCTNYILIKQYHAVIGTVRKRRFEDLIQTTQVKHS